MEFTAKVVLMLFFFKLNQKYFYDLVVLLELRSNGEIRRG